MVTVKGQFMIISAVLVTILLMSTAATMSGLKQNNLGSVDIDQDIHNLEDIGQKLDLGKKNDRKQFREATQYISSYSTDLIYVESKNCYNITLTNANEETRLTCVGNGSTFHDSFEDGERTDPLWNKKGRDGSIEVKRKYAPNGDKRSLVMEESGQTDNKLKIQTYESFGMWDQSWKTEGTFKTENLDQGVEQTHIIGLNINNNHNEEIKIQIGTTDQNGNNKQFKILDKGLINNAGQTSVSWQENTWYNWEIIHDGTGTYEGRVWKNSDPVPPMQVTATGGSSNLQGAVSIYLNTTHNSQYTIAHDYVKMNSK